MNTEPGKIAVVSGAARGIGRAITDAFLTAGHRVVAIDRNCGNLSSDEGGGLWVAEIDIGNRDAVRELNEQMQRRWGTASVLVNNAAVSPKQSNGASAGILDITPIEWDEVLRINLTGAFGLCQEFLPGMQRQRWGRIINMASLAGRTKSISAGASYMASKSGLIGLTRAIAAEMGPFGITANTVAPGRIVTEMSMTAGIEANNRIAQQLPVRRLGQPQEVAEAVLYLASASSGYVNGAVIDINGGIFMP